MKAEIDIASLIIHLSSVFNNGRIASDEEWSAVADAITLVKRVERLLPSSIRDFLETGEEW